jgi:hypothetical protein
MRLQGGKLVFSDHPSEGPLSGQFIKDLLSWLLRPGATHAVEAQSARSTAVAARILYLLFAGSMTR